MSIDTTPCLGFPITKDKMKRIGVRPSDILDENNRYQLMHQWAVINDPNFRGWPLLPGLGGV